MSHQKNKKLDLRYKPSIDGVRDYIKLCQKQNHVQQVAYSSYYDAITQVCFNCGLIRTNLVKHQVGL